MKKIPFSLIVFLTLSAGGSMHAAENIPSEQLVRFNEQQRKSVERLYKKWYSGPLQASLIKTGGPSRMAGRWAHSKKSRRYIPRFIEKYSINTDEIAQPVESFNSFNDFFIRKLKPEARSLSADPRAILSPADGSALVMQNITQNTLYPTKKVSLSTEKMLQNKALAQKFDGGTAFVIRLAPWDYHRFHFPLSGLPGKARVVAGRYESVSPAVYQAGIQPLEVNERHIIIYQPDKTSTVAIILVGALFVGSIVETYTPGLPYKAGDEMGYYEFGGSTIVLLFQKDTITVMPEIVADSAQGKETPVKMGQTIGHVIPESEKYKINNFKN